MTKEPKYKIYEGKLKDILRQCLDQGRRPLTMFEVVTARNQKKIPWQYYHTSTVENVKTGEMFDASVTQLRSCLKQPNQWWTWCVYYLDSRSLANGINDLDNDCGRLVGILPSTPKQQFKEAFKKCKELGVLKK